MSEMRYRIFLLGVPMVMFLFIDTDECKAQDNSILDKWYMQVTTEYNMPIWISDFKSFLDAHQSNVNAFMGGEVFGWEVGMPICGKKGMKLICELLSSQNSALSDRSLDVSWRYNFHHHPNRMNFSVDLGLGHQSYSFSYFDRQCSHIIAIDGSEDTQYYTVFSYNITQLLWNAHTAVNVEIKLSKHLFLAVALKYRFLFNDKTYLNNFHNPIADFPKVSNHDVAINCGLSYYFDKLQ